jgi:hypothetical protein
MPQQAQCALWLCPGKPERYTLKGKHQEAFLSMTLVRLKTTSKRPADSSERRVLLDDASQSNATTRSDKGSTPCPAEESFL